MTQSMMLARHGTNPNPLPLSAILSAARRDLEVRRLKAEKASWIEMSQRYAFHHRHVRLASSAAELLLIAAQAPELAARTSLPNRVLLYRDPERLVDAAELVLHIGGGNRRMTARSISPGNGSTAPSGGRFRVPSWISLTGVAGHRAWVAPGTTRRETVVRFGGRFLPKLRSRARFAPGAAVFSREVTLGRR